MIGLALTIIATLFVISLAAALIRPLLILAAGYFAVIVILALFVSLPPAIGMTLLGLLAVAGLGMALFKIITRSVQIGRNTTAALRAWDEQRASAAGVRLTWPEFAGVRLMSPPAPTRTARSRPGHPAATGG